MSELIPDDVFDEDYLYFYETFLTDEVSDTDAALVARLSELTPGERVLDAPCGHGRIARRLAVTGARVTGVDRSELFIERARADAAEHAVEVDYRVGDVRELPVEDGGADVVVNWFSSFGYFDDAGNEAVLAEFARALRPGGRLVLETMSPAAVLRSIPAGSSTLPSLTWRGADHLIDETRVDLAAGIMHTRHTTTRDGRTRSVVYSLRFHFPTELARMLAAAGFDDVRFLGDGGARLTVTSSRVIALARRRAD